MIKKRHIMAKSKRRIRAKLIKIFPLSWVRLDDLPGRNEKEEKEEVSHWFRMF